MYTQVIPSANAQSPQQSNAYVWRIATIAALGGLLFGYDWVVIGGARQFYESYFQLSSPTAIGWANSSALLGCLVGSFISGFFADRFGRRPLLILSAAIFVFSSVATGLASTFASFVLWRILGGTAIGIASNISPIYIAEISPAPQRGRLVSLNQFSIVVGILLAQIVNAFIARSDLSASAHAWNLHYGWRWMFCAVAVPSLLFFVGSLLLPESPRWLAAHGQSNPALRTLQRINGVEGGRRELDIIQRELSHTQAEASGWSDLLQPRALKILLIAIGLAVLQQWTGINILFNYAAEIYTSAGYGSGDVLFQIVITGAINLAATVLAMFLVDRIGRRKLMLAGCLGIGTSHLLCAWAYARHLSGLLILLLTLTAIACYACTLAPITWVLITELFPNQVRTRGTSISVTALWIASFLLTYTFPFLVQSAGMPRTFSVYGIVCLAGFVLVLTCVPETRGRQLENIEIHHLES
jgi:sugar porter (SP) family MFS transporter